MHLTAMSVSALAVIRSTRSFVLPLKPPSAPITQCLARTRCQRMSSRTHSARNTAADTQVGAASSNSPSTVLGRGREVRCNGAIDTRVAVIVVVRQLEVRITAVSATRPAVGFGASPIAPIHILEYMNTAAATAAAVVALRPQPFASLVLVSQCCFVLYW